MADIARPIKTFGTDRYTTEVLANAPNDTIIKAVEVDADLDRLYQTINNLDDANIAVGANIHGSKIASGTLPAGSIAPGSITDTQVSASANINAAKLLAHSVGARELSLTAVLRQLVTAAPPPNLNIASTETTMLSFPAITLHANSRIVIFGLWSATLQISALGAGFPAYDVRWKRNGTTFRTVTSQASLAGNPGDPLIGFLPLPVPAVMDTSPGVGVYTYSLTYQTGGTAAQIFVPNDPDVGSLWLLEIGGDA